MLEYNLWSRINFWAMGGITFTILFSWCIKRCGGAHKSCEVRIWFQLCCYLALLRITEPAVKYSSRIVETRSGLVRGIVVDPERKRLEPVEIFKSIPYAKPPSGTLRLEPAQKIDPWQGTFLAERFGPVCPQVRLLTGFRLFFPLLPYVMLLFWFVSNQVSNCCAWSTRLASCFVLLYFSFPLFFFCNDTAGWIQWITYT